MARLYVVHPEDRQKVIDLIKKYKGKIAPVAQEMGCCVATIYNYANRYKSVKKAIKQAKETWDCTLVDAAETKLYQAVTRGSAWAVKYALETKGRKRGYTTSPVTEEDEGSKMQPVSVKIIVSDQSKEGNKE